MLTEAKAGDIELKQCVIDLVPDCGGSKLKETIGIV